MKINKHFLNGAFIIELEPCKDSRGEFTRLFCQNEFGVLGWHKQIVQINHSFTIKKGVIRGLHFQNPPKAETKIVKCINGSVFDVCIDLRCGSPTFLNWYSNILSGDDHQMVYIPEGFAHGYQTLETNSELIYFHSEFYSPECESGVRYDDPLIAIKWPITITEISEKDKKHNYIHDNYKGILL